MAKYDVFLSYRREGGFTTAKHLYDLMKYDGYRVSFDIDTLRNGDFDTALLKRIDQCKDFILIVDPNAFDRSIDESFNPGHDWLRQELAYALKKNKNIIPVFLNNVKGFPTNLPPDIAGVISKNGPEYNRYYFDDFYNTLKSRFLTSKPVIKYRKFLVVLIGLLVIGGLLAVIISNALGENGKNSNNPRTAESVNANENILENNVSIKFYTKGPYNDEPGWESFQAKIYAVVDGFEYMVETPEDECYRIESQEDFDNDGVDDALVRHVVACGGNGFGDSYFFVKYAGNGFFTISEEFGNNVWEDPVIEDWEGYKSVVIVNSNLGMNNEKPVSTRERYIFRQGKAVRVENAKQQGFTSLIELKSTEFNDDDSEVRNFSFDLNEDGMQEKVGGLYWSRWGSIWPMIWIDGRIIKGNYGVKRIGVLSSKTNGYHDLLIDNNTIWKWNGSEYQNDENDIVWYDYEELGFAE